MSLKRTREAASFRPSKMVRMYNHTHLSIITALREGHYQCAQNMLDSGEVHIDQKYNGFPAFHHLCGNSNACEFLCANGAIVNDYQNSTFPPEFFVGSSYLCSLANSCDVDQEAKKSMRILLRYGADPNSRVGTVTALMYCHDVTMAMELVNAGAKYDLENQMFSSGVLSRLQQHEHEKRIEQISLLLPGPTKYTKGCLGLPTDIIDHILIKML